MQRIQGRRKSQREIHRDIRGWNVTRLWVGLAGLVWVAGLMIAGSDSPYMPWVNGIGAFLFLGASLILSRLLPRLDPAGRQTKLQQGLRPGFQAVGRAFSQTSNPSTGRVYGSTCPAGRPAHVTAGGSLLSPSRGDIGTGYACEI